MLKKPLINCIFPYLAVFFISLSLSSPVKACRLWAAISDSIPESVIINNLSAFPNSIENLSALNPNGWGIAFYRQGTMVPDIQRGETAAYLDPCFDTAVAAAGQAKARTAIAHIRNCSSGLCDIANPHPFCREKNGRQWLFGHNGTISKTILLSLIDPDYLAANPPQYGANQSEWIDSDLYFIFLMQTMEEKDWQVKPSLGNAIYKLHEAIPEAARYLNFFLTDGDTLWSYCEGNTLCYLYDTLGVDYTAVASQYPDAVMGDWVWMSARQLLSTNIGRPPRIENIENYYNLSNCCDMAGDANHDGLVNITDIIYILNSLYRKGPLPICQGESNRYPEADADGNSMVNLLDVSLLLNYLYRNGVAPVCGASQSN